MNPAVRQRGGTGEGHDHSVLHAHAANAKVVTLTLGVLAALVQAFPGGVLVGQGDALRRGVEAARLRHVGNAGVEDQAGSLLSKL